MRKKHPLPPPIVRKAPVEKRQLRKSRFLRGINPSDSKVRLPPGTPNLKSPSQNRLVTKSPRPSPLQRMNLHQRPRPRWLILRAVDSNRWNRRSPAPSIRRSPRPREAVSTPLRQPSRLHLAARSPRLNRLPAHRCLDQQAPDPTLKQAKQAAGSIPALVPGSLRLAASIRLVNPYRPFPQMVAASLLQRRPRQHPR